MAKTLKDWPSNCEADFFDALGQPESPTFFDLTRNKDLMYYARFHDPVTHDSHVIPEATLAGFLEALQKDFKESVPGPFLGFHDDLEEIWWPAGPNESLPVPTGIFGITSAYINGIGYVRAKIVFYVVQKTPEGWLSSPNPGDFHVRPIREWLVDHTNNNLSGLEVLDDEMPEADDSSSEESDDEPVSFGASISYRNQVFMV